jgi:hypothetical protein
MERRPVRAKKIVWLLRAGLLIASTASLAQTPETQGPPPDCTPFAANTVLTADLLKEHVLPPCAAAVTFKDTANVKGTRLENLQRGFDLYSWLTFVALNSPSHKLPDGRDDVFGKDAPTVWESWKEIDDVMLTKEERAQHAQEFPRFEWRHTPPECKLPAGKPPASLVVHMEEDTFDQPFKSGPLVDQNGRFALNVILMNREMFGYIVSQKLYSREGQAQFAEVVDFPSGTNGNADTAKGALSGPLLGAMMVKASWKELPDQDDPTDFHTIGAFVYVPALAGKKATCDWKRLGLVGFHVAHKTTDRNQWVWTTFEQIRNVPGRTAPTGPRTTGAFNFHNGACAEADCPVNETPPVAWDMLHPPAAFRSQIVRVNPATSDAERISDDARRLPGIAGTVWANYTLISTQWPADFQCAGNTRPGSQDDPTCAPAPVFLANSTLETFSQEDPHFGGIPQATSSCIGCHNNATTHHKPATPSDFTYILEKAK